MFIEQLENQDINCIFDDIKLFLAFSSSFDTKLLCFKQGMIFQV